MPTYSVNLGGREFRVRIDEAGAASIDGQTNMVEARTVGTDAYSVLINGISTLVVAEGSGLEYQVLVRGSWMEARVLTARDQLLLKYSAGVSAATRRYEVRAPMPALVVRVEVQEGDEVAAGQGVLVLEAMKMENELKAHQAGRVKKICAEKGSTVEKGELLLLLE